MATSLNMLSSAWAALWAHPLLLWVVGAVVLIAIIHPAQQQS